MNPRVLFVPFVLALIAPIAFAQMDRRGRRDPALVLEPGGRTGTCDVLRFSPDGKSLLAVGDDKVVAGWPVSDSGIDGKSLQLLRWPIWREQHGAIYAMDISADGARVAVGGYGMRSSTVAVIERATGKIVATTYPGRGTQEDANAVTAVAFSSDGNQLAIGTGDGSVWTWNLAVPNAHAVKLGRHTVIRNGLSWVRFVRFDQAGFVLSIAEDGRLKRWSGGEGETVVDLELKGATVRAAALSTGNTWLAAATTKVKDKVALRSLDRTRTIDIDLKEDRHAPRAVAFSPDGKRLAVAIGAAVPLTPFFIETNGIVSIFEIGTAATKSIDLKRAGRPEALAWLGTNRLAVAGGNHHEVVLWDLAKPKEPISEARGAGTGLWGVGLSGDRYLVFQDHRATAATHPNERGEGSWRTFDLKTRRFDADAAKNVKPVAPRRTADNWIVVPDVKDSYVWYARDPNGKDHQLPLMRDQDGKPNCFTFLKKTDKHPTRLVVGHYWGLSVFDLTADGARRVRLLTGHHGEVTAVAPSADDQWIVSASNDQTIAAWNMQDWPSGSVFGVSFKPNTLIVNSVDLGGPAWELGLVAGDEIILTGMAKDKKRIHAATENVRITDDKGTVLLNEPQKGTADDVRQMIENATPGPELFLVWKRPGRKVPIGGRTTMRTRPVWRFFPTDDNEWVLWMWQGSFYDCSTHGDFFIGWQMNDPTVEAQPRFFRAEQMRKKFQRKDVIDELVLNRDPQAALRLALGANPVPLNFETVELSTARIEIAEDETKGDVKAKLTAMSRDDNPDRVPVRVELWINEFRFREWKPGGQSWELEETIPVSALRSGENRLTLQVFNRLEGRAEFVKKLVNLNPPQKLRAFGFAAGIDDYSHTAKSPDGKRNLFGNLTSAVNDAKKQHDAWMSQRGKLYDTVDMPVKPNQDAAPKNLIAVLERLKTEARPDDRLILCLSGHGDFLSGKDVKSTFVFCGPNYSREKYEESGLDSKTLFEKLADINCRKVVFLDACHSGDIAFNPIRALAPSGQGPTILAACDRSEYSYEHPKYGNGLFTYAVMHALGEGFDDADESKDGRLDAVELFRSVQKQMPALLKSVGFPEHAQNPVIFPRRPPPERFAIYQK